MVFNLIPNDRQDCQPLVQNNPGWIKFGKTCDALGCDTHEWSFEIDGAPVCAETARAWADAITAALREGRIRLWVTGKEPISPFSLLGEYVVIDKPVPKQEWRCGWHKCGAATAADGSPGLQMCAGCNRAYYCCAEHQRLAWSGGEHKKSCRSIALPERDQRWFSNVAAFLASSGGFEQRWGGYTVGTNTAGLRDPNLNRAVAAVGGTIAYFRR